MRRFFDQSKKLILIIGDVGILYLSLYLALAIRYRSEFTDVVWGDHLYPFTVSFIVWIVIFYIAGLYERQGATNNYSFYSSVFTSVLTALIATIMLFYLVPSFGITPKTNLLIMGAVFFALFLLWRHGYNLLIRSSRLLHPTMFIGSNKEMESIISLIETHPQLGYHATAKIECPRTSQELISFIQEKEIDTLVYTGLTLQCQGSENMSKILYALLPLGITIIDLPTFYAHITNKIPISIIGETWFFENLIESEKGFFEIEKRVFDIVCSLLGSIITLPFFPLIALLIRANSAGPAFYTHQRVGKNGKLFLLIKFRTMIDHAEQAGAQWTKAEDVRITRIGKILRATRIDELPQLWNVLKGDMSFVGPRPERPEFVAKNEQAIPYYQMRHLVRPGLAGWAQIHHPLASASIEDSTEKLQYDLYYVKNRSFIIDLDVVAKTILVVLRREGR